MFDDEATKKKPDFEIGQNLEEMSVGELASTIQILKEEIARLEEACQQKSSHLDAAKALFSKPD